MSLLHFSAAKGPDECCLALSKALARFLQEAADYGLNVELVESEQGNQPGTFRSAIVSVEGEFVGRLSKRWLGSIQCICLSPYRPKYKRKN